jgi:hypothetical protein
MHGQIEKDHIHMASGWRGAAPICLGSWGQNCNEDVAGTKETQRKEDAGGQKTTAWGQTYVEGDRWKKQSRWFAKTN